MTEWYVKTYVYTHVVDVNASHTPAEGAHSPSWPNGFIIIIFSIIIMSSMRTIDI
jgi:hypothetical protein